MVNITTIDTEPNMGDGPGLSGPQEHPVAPFGLASAIPQESREFAETEGSSGSTRGLSATATTSRATPMWPDSGAEPRNSRRPRRASSSASQSRSASKWVSASSPDFAGELCGPLGGRFGRFWEWPGGTGELRVKVEEVEDGCLAARAGVASRPGCRSGACVGRRPTEASTGPSAPRGGHRSGPLGILDVAHLAVEEPRAQRAVLRAHLDRAITEGAPRVPPLT
jgi:hypothetical protein